MDVHSGALWLPCTPLRHYLAHVHPILAGGINPSAMAASFQAKGSADTKRLCVSRATFDAHWATPRLSRISSHFLFFGFGLPSF